MSRAKDLYKELWTLEEAIDELNALGGNYIACGNRTEIIGLTVETITN